jgi:hypothetical protein
VDAVEEEGVLAVKARVHDERDLRGHTAGSSYVNLVETSILYIFERLT